MYKNQLQELAQRSCFNLPAYTCIREGPDHAPRFKATVNFNGETYECPNYCTTLRQAEHSAAEVALNALANRGPSNSLAARILDETGVYKNLLQEVSQRVGASLPTYKTSRSGLGHLPIFTCTVDLAGVTFTGEPAKNKKQAEKNAAMAAWSALKLLAQQSENSSQKVNNDEQEHVTVARALQKYRIRAKMSNIPFPIRYPMPKSRAASTQQSPAATSKILPLICSKPTPWNRTGGTSTNNSSTCPKTSSQSRYINPTRNDILGGSSLHAKPSGSSVNEWSTDSSRFLPQKFPAAGAAPYIPLRHFKPHHGMAPPVTIRHAIPAYSAPPFPPIQPVNAMRSPHLGMAPPVSVRQVVPAFAAPVRPGDSLAFKAPITQVAARVDDLPAFKAPTTASSARLEDSSPTPVTPSSQEEASLTIKSHAVPLHIHLENPPTAKAPCNLVSIGVENASNLKFPNKISTVNVEIQQASETPVSAPLVSSRTVETGVAVETKLPESLMIEELNELKV
ncbi:double-stranded RNA-binding protein 2-like [Apium graveolens]|uniref:double-stranded RNA-binding protein 2-like n=1 Tax=Apium graveolens TaxID=4045 RepID=UPI003D7A27CF